MIRHATPDDIPALLVMGKAFADEAGVSDLVGWDDASVTALLTNLIEHDDGLLLIGDQSMFGGVAYAHPFNNAAKVFQELFWRSHGREGLKALHMAEDWMRGRGISRSLMLGLDTMPNLERLYGRLGYRPAERTFIKEI